MKCDKKEFKDSSFNRKEHNKRCLACRTKYQLLENADNYDNNVLFINNILLEVKQMLLNNKVQEGEIFLENILDNFQTSHSDVYYMLGEIKRQLSNFFYFKKN